MLGEFQIIVDKRAPFCSICPDLSHRTSRRHPCSGNHNYRRNMTNGNQFAHPPRRAACSSTTSEVRIRTTSQTQQIERRIKRMVVVDRDAGDIVVHLPSSPQRFPRDFRYVVKQGSAHVKGCAYR